MNKRTVLVVDADEVSRKILRQSLSHDYVVLEAQDGAIALSVLQRNNEIISAVLLNLLLPIIDGYEVLRYMRSDLFLSKIPIIAASEQASEDAERKALLLGANDYVPKPYNTEIIKYRVSNIISLTETASLTHSAQRDALTGLCNQAYFYRCASKLLEDHPQKKYDLICCDIDHFKLVNDLYGTQTGDHLLRYVADVMVERVGEHGICGRLCADVFACVMEHRDSYQGSDFIEAIEYVNQLNANLKIILRYGIYCIEDRSIPINIMCDRARLAKQSIKGKYGAHFAYYDDEARQALLEEQFITTNMKAALEDNQFQVHFQPKYDLKTEQIVGAEALVRWIHPQKGFMSPGEFIPLFERNGFVTDLDLYVWDQCCQKLRSWLDNGNRITPISVNVSRADIYNPHLPEILFSMIQRYRLSPKYLHLEITETAYTENPEQLIEVVSKLKQLGFIIEMDDFGAGYSSLNMLSELPIDVLKLDMKFIQSESKKKNNRSILSFIISLAKWLNLSVVAEGVETDTQVQLLQSLNCEYAQGYYYSKPLSQGIFESLLKEADIQPLYSGRHNEALTTVTPKSKENPKMMLILDEDSQDYRAFQPFFEKIYQVVQAQGHDEALDLIQQFKTKIAVFVINGSDVSSIDQIVKFQDVCQMHNIPMVVIDNALNEPLKEGLRLGVADYILRPYDAEALQNRIENVILQAQIKQFQKEKEINAAMFEMKKRTDEDSLTGLLNRAEFEVRIDAFLDQNQNPQGVFVILDIDNFKQVNDTLGHMIGDQALCKVAETLNEIFSETNLISRIGGDEFALFVPCGIDASALKRKMQKLCRTIDFSVKHMHISCSAGVCIAPEYGVSYEQLYHNADIALLTAKRLGKSQYKIFKEGMELPPAPQLESKAAQLLDDTSDAMFVSDSITSEIIYINETACRILNKDKKSCLGSRCYQLFWDRCLSCDRCFSIGTCEKPFYEEDTYLMDRKTSVHIKAKMGDWDGRKVKIHYLQHLTVQPERMEEAP